VTLSTGSSQGGPEKYVILKKITALNNEISIAISIQQSKQILKIRPLTGTTKV
jgi:hypothetical protein